MSYNYGTRVTPEKIEKAKDLLARGCKFAAVASSVGVSLFTINRIRKGWYDTGKLVTPKIKGKDDLYDYSYF